MCFVLKISHHGEAGDLFFLFHLESELNIIHVEV